MKKQEAMMRNSVPSFHRLAPLAACLSLALVAGCGGDGDSTGVGAVTQIQVTPTSLQFEALTAAIQITATPQDADGNAVSGLTLTYGSNDPTVATVTSGGLVTAVDNGVAAITVGIEDSEIEETVAVTVEQEAFRLGFATLTAGQTREPFGPITVEIQDSLGALVEDATHTVTLSLGDNPGRLIFHASGFSTARIIELVDHVSGLVLDPPLRVDDGNDEILGLAYSSEADVVYATDRDSVLWSLDPVTGIRTEVDTTGHYLKGVALEPGAGGQLLAGGHANFTAGFLFEVDPATADTTRLDHVTIAGDSIEGFTGLNFDPTDGTLYGVVRLDGNAIPQDRNLVTIDVGTLEATNVAPLSENGVAGITFLADGSLLAVTGDGADNPEQLWTVDKATGAMTLIMALGNGDDGESIEAVPARLTGTLTVAAVAGVATFDGLEVSAPAAGYTVVATADGLAPHTSAPFEVTPVP